MCLTDVWNGVCTNCVRQVAAQTFSSTTAVQHVGTQTRLQNVLTDTITHAYTQLTEVKAIVFQTVFDLCLHATRHYSNRCIHIHLFHQFDNSTHIFVEDYTLKAYKLTS